MRRQLRLASVVLVVASGMYTASVPSPVLADTCTRYGWAKATLLSDNIGFPDTTWAETREQGYWKTSGGKGSCYGKGLYGQVQVTNQTYSYCYWNPLAGAGWIQNDSCYYYLSKDYWYNDGTRDRYLAMYFRVDGSFTWDDPACIDPCPISDALR